MGLVYRYSRPMAWSPRLIRGDGPSPCRLMAVGEAGGRDEHFWRPRPTPFVGRSGDALDANLIRVGLSRAGIYITNVFPFWTGPGNPDPTPSQIKAHQHHLISEINRVRPRYILAIGRVASRWFLGDISMETAHGLPHLPDDWHWSKRGIKAPKATIIPCFHPAAGLRDPGIAAKVLYDMQQFALISQGKLSAMPVKDAFPKPNYQLSPFVIFENHNPGVDTEWDPSGKPIFLSYSTRAGTGRVVKAEDVRATLRCAAFPIILHNAMGGDLEALRQLGTEVGLGDFEDTSILARLLQVLPRTLKELGRYLLGVRMREYNDVVMPHAYPAALRYLNRAADKAGWPPAEEHLEKDKATGEWRIKRPHGVGTRLKAMRTTLTNDPGRNPWTLWSHLPKPYVRVVEKRMKKPFPEYSLRCVPEAEAASYAGADADVTRRIWPPLVVRAKALGLLGCYELDRDSIPMFEAMERNGMPLDTSLLAKVRPAFVKQLSVLEKQFIKLYRRGRAINLASGDQMAAFFYGELKIRPPRLTDTGKRGKVDEATLDVLSSRPGCHPAVPMYQRWKKQATQLSFLDRLPKHVRRGRIHAHIDPIGTITGRPATSDPNMLNIPVRTEEGRRIRMAFVAEKGRLLLSADYSQLELRILASNSGDKRMVRAFRNGEDIHQQVADEYGLERTDAKTLDFGIPYGMNDMKLYTTLLEAGRINDDGTPIYPFERCREIIERWFRRFSGVRGYFDEVYAETRRHGFVREPLSGRIRYLPNIGLPIGSPARAEAERHAGNFPIQAGNSFIIKKAMRRIWVWLQANQDLGVVPCLQIYDDLVFEGPEDIIPDIAPIIRTLMLEDAHLFRVPLAVNVKYGRAWGDLK